MEAWPDKGKFTEKPQTPVACLLAPAAEKWWTHRATWAECSGIVVAPSVGEGLEALLSQDHMRVLVGGGPRELMTQDMGHHLSPGTSAA